MSVMWSNRKSDSSCRFTIGSVNGEFPEMRESMFADAEDMKKKLMENLNKPVYDVKNFYKKTGLPQKIARANWFEHLTLSVIGVNAIWIALDSDLNHADMLLEAHPVFIIGENFFCGYFSFEWTMRFLSFRRKIDCFRDAWMVFDTILVAFMVVETWVMVFFLEVLGMGADGGMGNAGMLRLLRLLRLTRMARMARLLRSMPELLILVKGMLAAVRSVCFTLLLLGIFLYVFAIAFRTMTKGGGIEERYFPNMFASINTLFMDGVLLDGIGALVRDMMLEDNAIMLLIVMYFFVLIASFTVLNMLIGVICDMVSNVSAHEHDSLAIAYVKERLRIVVDEVITVEGEVEINKDLFLEILQRPTAASLLSEVEIDVFSLVDLADTIFATDYGHERVLSFGDLVEVMMDCRETESATVKDVTQLRKFLCARYETMDTEQSTTNIRLQARLAAFTALAEEAAGGEPVRVVELPTSEYIIQSHPMEAITNPDTNAECKSSIKAQKSEKSEKPARAGKAAAKKGKSTKSVEDLGGSMLNGDEAATQAAEAAKVSKKKKKTKSMSSTAESSAEVQD